MYTLVDGKIAPSSSFQQMHTIKCVLSLQYPPVTWKDFGVFFSILKNTKPSSNDVSPMDMVMDTSSSFQKINLIICPKWRKNYGKLGITLEVTVLFFVMCTVHFKGRWQPPAIKSSKSPLLLRSNSVRSGEADTRVFWDNVYQSSAIWMAMHERLQT